MTDNSIPKTVTFGGEPRTEAQVRAARRGGKVFGLLGLAAGLIALPVVAINTKLAVDLSRTWGEVALFIPITVALTAAIIATPATAAILSRNYSTDGKLAMSFWRLGLLLSALAGSLYVATLDTSPAALDPVAARRAEELRTRLGHLYRDDWRLWQQTAECTSPVKPVDVRACRSLLSRRADERAEIDAIERGQWTAAGILGAGELSRLGAIPESLRRVMLWCLIIAAMAAAGFLARLDLLANGESYRLGEGTASGLEPMRAAPSSLGSAAVSSPLDVFNEWWAGRVIEDEAGQADPSRLSATVAFDDYLAGCAMNGQAPLNQRGFGELMGNRAAASGGRIRKTKASGNWWVGIRLADDGAEAGNVHPIR